MILTHLDTPPSTSFPDLPLKKFCFSKTKKKYFSKKIYPLPPDTFTPTSDQEGTIKTDERTTWHTRCMYDTQNVRVAHEMHVWHTRCTYDLQNAHLLNKIHKTRKG